MCLMKRFIKLRSCKKCLVSMKVVQLICNQQVIGFDSLTRHQCSPVDGIGRHNGLRLLQSFFRSVSKVVTLCEKCSMLRHTWRFYGCLDIRWVIIEKSINENQGNCWNSLRVPLTTAWLETVSANVKNNGNWPISSRASKSESDMRKVQRLRAWHLTI